MAVFRGIPFAAPPVGNLRFMPPVTVSPWKVEPEHWAAVVHSTVLHQEPLLADKFGPVCPQNLPLLGNRTSRYCALHCLLHCTVLGSLARLSAGRLLHLRRSLPRLQNQSEDCLYLNVFVPESGAVLLRLKIAWVGWTVGTPA